MRRRLLPLFLALGLALAGAVLTGPAPSRADPVVVPDIDGGLATCTQLTPHAVAVTGEPVRLDVRILLDGVTRDHAEQGVVSMRKAYRPLGIGVAATYDVVDLSGVDAQRLIEQAKDRYGGRRPAGVDVVYAMTVKDITSTGPTGGQLIGQADCIGGVRTARTAFAVGEIGRVTIPTTTEGTGKVMAHEVGHLLGGHHHYASAEGLLASDPATMSLMGPAIDLDALRFSSLNQLMVRGHAQRYAD
ncbi:hypothetical protein NPS01_09220 [Nocardioides psychrotolerans]|uniref:Metallo-peptidase family M12B Reprolysin-like n=1 Tax=Nocardioides psychrotolerans TaxID=1005945 RepID=A0A1I3FQP0_9ACTN|nr:zinc-dependent metalloprotease family protein [Nocardioides psychrotolerans]GEP37259.1 hypothetical protein NPS01_09220 [Nocardioides psychrotolerans]SFI13484.1 Metallo-peptidase family M12B Reprolysin-like [Nocardioides psychrotolerans]